VRLQPDFNPALGTFLVAEPNILIDKSHTVLNAIQNRLNLELDSWSPRRGFFCGANFRLTRPLETSSFFSAALRAALACASLRAIVLFPSWKSEQSPTDCATEPEFV
jgi:hypothetical protein